MHFLLKQKSGMSLVEVIIASAIVLSLSLILISVNLTYLKTTEINLKSVKSTYLIEEGIETVNFLKNNDWANLGNLGTTYYLIWTGSAWAATTTQSYVDQIFERKFITESVNRDSNNDIVLINGILDTNTRKLTVSVSWIDASGTTTKSISSYLMK